MTTAAVSIGDAALKAFSSSGMWAILPQELSLMASELSAINKAGGPLQPRSRPSPRTAGSVAVIPIVGAISYRLNLLSLLLGGTSVQLARLAFRQAMNDPHVKAIVLDMDSPGGEVDGIQEFADEIFGSRKYKRIVAISNTLAASGAYWLASAASEVIASPSSLTGSIGVFTVHDDRSKANDVIGIKPTYIYAGRYKTEGNPDEPLSDEAKAAMQHTIDSYYSAFVNAVARNRGVSASDVRKGFGQGRVLVAREARQAGLVDRVASFEGMLSRFAGGPGQAKTLSAYRAALQKRRAELEHLQ